MMECFSYLDVRYLLIPGTYYMIFYVLMWKDFHSLKVFSARPSTRRLLGDFVMSQVAILVYAATVTLMLLNRSLFYMQWSDPFDDGVLWFALTVIYLVALHDCWFYWTHRMLHIPILMRWVHSWHHASHNPSPWTGYAFHPLESAVQAAFLPFALFFVPIRVSDLSIAIWMTLQLLQNIYAHGGFEFFPPSFIQSIGGCYWNTAVHHALHHKTSRGNFGLYTCVWDRLCGTHIPETERTFFDIGH